MTFAGFEIAMDDTRPMCGGERIGELRRDEHRLVQGQRFVAALTCETRGERLALEVLHDEELDARGRPDIVERADVRMRKRCDRARFALEANTRTFVVKQTWRDYLDGNNAAEPRVARAIDLAHPPAPSGLRILATPSRTLRRETYP